jgi:phage terminase large subunit-like protein
MDKVTRMNTVTTTIENGFVHLPDNAGWLAEYLHELASFPKGKFDDQADSTSQALDWLKQYCLRPKLWAEVIRGKPFTSSFASNFVSF